MSKSELDPDLTTEIAKLLDHAIKRTVVIDYTNHRGERGRRPIIPVRVWFGRSQWHLGDGDQWFLNAYDRDKGDERDFALKYIHGFGTTTASSVSDESRLSAWAEAVSAFTVVAYMIRDAARRARDSGLQKDDEEFDRLIGLFNLPAGSLFDTVMREIKGNEVAKGAGS
jgi:predicted DNA-binding transcriptional regulator YafY